MSYDMVTWIGMTCMEEDDVLLQSQHTGYAMYYIYLSRILMYILYKQLQNYIKTYIMKNLFRVILIIMCGIGCWGTVVATNAHEFVMGATAMCISGLMFIITVKED